jgi:hypothetical protein
MGKSYTLSHFVVTCCRRPLPPSRREDLQIAPPVSGRDFASCAFHPPLPSRQGMTLGEHQGVQMRQPSQKRLGAPFRIMKALQYAQVPVDGLLGLLQQGAHHRHMRGCASSSEASKAPGFTIKSSMQVWPSPHRIQQPSRYFRRPTMEYGFMKKMKRMLAEAM